MSAKLNGSVMRRGSVSAADGRGCPPPGCAWKLAAWAFAALLAFSGAAAHASATQPMPFDVILLTMAETWTLSIQAPEGQGSTDPVEGDHPFDVADDAEVAANPADNWKLSHWVLDGEDAGAENPLPVLAGQDGERKELQAVFVRQTWTLSVLEPAGEGATDIVPGEYEHNVGDEVQVEVEATPELGWRLGYWLLDDEAAGWDNPIAVASGEDGQTKAIRAVFEPVPDLYVAKSSHGAVNPGGEITFVIAYGIRNQSDARGVVIHETLPDDVEYDSATDGGIFNPADSTITWNIGDLPADMQERTVEFVVKEAGNLGIGDTITNADYTIKCEDTDPVPGDPVEVEVVDDNDPPEAKLVRPEESRLSRGQPDLQVPRDTLVVVEVSDPGSGVDFRAVQIRVNDDLVYDGAAEDTEGAYDTRHTGQTVRGVCRRVAVDAGNPDGKYRFAFVREGHYPFGTAITVRVEAADRAANVMDPAAEFGFRIATRPFGTQFRVNTVLSGCSRPALARDAGGNMWAAWQRTVRDGSQVWAARRDQTTGKWSESVRVDGTGNKQSAPAVALHPDGSRAYVAWEDRRQASGLPAIFVAYSDDRGLTWSEPVRANTASGKAVMPAMAVRDDGRAYVAWTDGRDGRWNIYLAWWDENERRTRTERAVTNISEGQKQPALAAVGDEVFLVWTDDRNGIGRSDIYGASSVDDWAVASEVVVANGNQRRPALAVEADGAAFHLAWEDDRDGGHSVYYGSGATLGWALDPATVQDVVAGEPAQVRDASQTWPAVQVAGTGNDSKAFVVWQDARHAGVPAVYFAETGSGLGDPVLVKESAAAQAEPALAIDRHGNPVVLWQDTGARVSNVAGAGSIGFTPVGGVVPAKPGDSISVRPRELGPDSPGISIPRGAVETDVDIVVSRVENPPNFPPNAVGKPWKFSPAGLWFNERVTIEIPVSAAEIGKLDRPYRVLWYDEEKAAAGLNPWSHEGIADVRYDRAAGVLRFTTPHFSIFIAAGRVIEDSDNGCCSMTGGSGPGDPMLLLLPWLAVLGLTVRHQWRRRPNAA